MKHNKLSIILPFIFILAISVFTLSSKPSFGLDDLEFFLVKTNSVYNDRANLTSEEKEKISKLDQCTLGNTEFNNKKDTERVDDQCPSGNNPGNVAENTKPDFSNPTSTTNQVTCDQTNPKPYIDQNIVINDNKVDSGNRDAVVNVMNCIGGFYKRQIGTTGDDASIPTQCQNTKNEDVLANDISKTVSGNVGSSNEVIVLLKTLILKNSSFMVTAINCGHPRDKGAISADHVSGSSIDIIPRKTQDSNSTEYKTIYSDLVNFFQSNSSAWESKLEIQQTVNNTVIHVKVGAGFNPTLTNIR